MDQAVLVIESAVSGVVYKTVIKDLSAFEAQLPIIMSVLAQHPLHGCSVTLQGCASHGIERVVHHFANEITLDEDEEQALFVSEFGERLAALREEQPDLGDALAAVIANLTDEAK